MDDPHMHIESLHPVALYIVVRNDEDQYSIWRADSPLPLGWTGIGSPGPKDQCLDRIRTLWTDLRPASLRTPSA